MEAEADSAFEAGYGDKEKSPDKVPIYRESDKVHQAFPLGEKRTKVVYATTYIWFAGTEQDDALRNKRINIHIQDFARLVFSLLLVRMRMNETRVEKTPCIKNDPSF